MSTEHTVGSDDPSAIARQAPAGHVSQFGLLRTRRLLPLFITQFLGAFNDNLYKFALTLILVYGGMISEDATDLLVNVAAGLLILPFFLFSATAGTLADRYEKSRLIRYVKLGEIAVAICAALALYLQDVTALLAVVFLLGVQSTFFGPLKFAILPQHLHNTELVGGNAMVEMGTLVAILLGTIAGGIIGGATAGDNSGSVSLLLSVLVVMVAVTGYLTSLGIPRAPSALRGSVSWNPVTETWGLIRLAAEKKAVFQSVLGVSWFWLIGSVYLAQIANMTRLHLAGDSGVVTLILAFFTISIAVGSLLCEKLSGRRVEIGLVPLGAAGISLFGIDSYFAMGQIEAEGLRTAREFLAGEGTPRLLADLGLMGMFAGMFVVPLQANIQARTPGRPPRPDHRRQQRPQRAVPRRRLGSGDLLARLPGLQHPLAVPFRGHCQRRGGGLHLPTGAGIHHAVPGVAAVALHVSGPPRESGSHSRTGACGHRLQPRQLCGCIAAGGRHPPANPVRNGQEHLRPAGAEFRVSNQPNHPHHIEASRPRYLRRRFRPDP